MWHGGSGDLQESAGTPGQENSVSFFDDSEEGEGKVTNQLAAGRGQPRDKLGTGEQQAEKIEQWSSEVRRTYEIPNSKHQITNKSQIPILNDQNRFGILNFGHCYLFVIWDL
jgi:hypothetical protein